MVSVGRLADQSDRHWPLDDSEESVVGTDWHQTTILNLRMGINEVAHLEAGPDAAVAWQALSQTIITGFRRPDGSRYRVLPDVFVFRKPIARDRSSLSLLRDGAPCLAIEVASESTYESDLDLDEGKGWSYAQAGIKEYLAVDPTGLYLPSWCIGWRLLNGQYKEFGADADGLWWSEELPLAFGVHDGRASVYDRRRVRQLGEGEISLELQRERAENAALRRRLADLEG